SVVPRRVPPGDLHSSGIANDTLGKLLSWMEWKRLESAAMNTQASNVPDRDPIMERLEDQIAWYDRKSSANQRYFKRIKIVEIAAAAFIPLLSAFNLPQMPWE